MSEGRASGPWYEAAFRRAYLDVYAHRGDAAAADEVAFVFEVLGLATGSDLLDAGCGAGRHTRALAARGARTVGLDLSEDLLHEARRRSSGATDAESTHPEPAYVRGDLRALPFRDGAFVCVASLFTTFGYFGDEDNSAQLAEFRRVVSRGGRLLLDFLNASHVRATLVPHSEREIAGCRLVEERAIRCGRVEKDVTLVDADGASRSWRETVALYDRRDMRRLLDTAGFRVTGEFGDLTGNAWTQASPRAVFVAVAR